METYKKLCEDIIEEHVAETLEYNKNHEDGKKTRRDVLEALLEDSENVFGNIDGSRTCDAWKAKQTLYEADAIFDSEIIELFSEIDENYFTETLKRGAETLDVVILELICPQVVAEMLADHKEALEYEAEQEAEALEHELKKHYAMEAGLSAEDIETLAL